MWTPNRIVAWAVALAALIGAAFAVPGTVTPQIGGGISSFDGGISAVSGVTVNPNCAQGATYIAALTAPSGTEQTAYKNAICGMVADGTWPILKGLYIFANTSAVNARVNAVSPGTFNLAQTGTCPFTADVGMAGDGTTCFNDPSFIPSTNGGGVMTATSASFGVCVLNTRGSINENSYGGTDGTNFTYLTPYFTAQTFWSNMDGGASPVASTGSAGSWIESRTGSAGSNSTLYLNASAVGTGSPSTVLLPVKILEHAFNNNGTTAGFSSDQHAYWFFGGGLSAGQVASVYSRLGAMLSALGIGGGCSNVFSAAPVFFNSATGVDANNSCQVSGSPCLTISKLNSLLYAGGADITLAGTGFTGCIALTAANVHGSAGSPIVLHGGTVTSTCGGANSGSSGPKTAAILLDSISATVNGVTVRGSGFVAGSATQYGIVGQNSSGSGTSTYLIENNDVSGFGVVSLGTGDLGADIHAGGFSDAAGFPVACGNVNMSVLNNTLHGATTTSGENNGFFGTGCGTVGASSQVQQLQGNLIFNISGIANNSNTGNGAFLGEGSTSFTCCATNSYIQFSLAHDIGGNGTTCGGPVGLWAYQTYGALLTFDEVYNVQGSAGFPGGGACDFSAFDFDIQAVTGLAQYLYGHNTGGPGFVFFQAGLQDVVRYSIFENTGSYNEDGGGAISVASGGGSGSSGFSFQAYNNTIFQNYTPGTSTPPSCLSLGFGASYTGGLWANNVCHNAVQDTFSRTYMVQGNSATGVASITMKNNDYFNAGGALTTAVSWPSPTNYTLLSDLQAGTGQETGSKIITTGFTAPPTGNCTWTPSSQSPTWPPSGCPSAYSTLAAGLKSAGANLASTDPVWFVAPQPTTAGTRDYYGNTIPGSGSCYNMGAFGTCP